MKYQVVLPSFEGPLDLLLHLIDTNELDIYNIPISFITGQYIDYMKSAQEIDVTLSSDFVVMAGTLLTIKARYLLPQRPKTLEGEEDLIDPRDELMERLLEYRLYKKTAIEFKEMAEVQANVFFRTVDDKQFSHLFPIPNPIGNLAVPDLTKAFLEILESVANRQKTMKLPKDEITLQDQTNHILDVLERQPNGVLFENLLSGQTVRILVTTFMALLELMHRSQIWVKQKNTCGDIFVFLAHNEGVVSQ